MVGPKASVLMPCGTRFVAFGSKLLSLVIGFSMLATSSVNAQGPHGPIQQTGFGGGGGTINRHLHPYPMQPMHSGGAKVSYEYIPPDRRGGQLAALGSGARELWYRLEYLNWSIEAPGQDPLGAPVPGGQPFNATVNGLPAERAVQPNGGAFDLDNNNGLRFTFGAPTRVGDFEGSVFILDQADSQIRQSPERRFDEPISPGAIAVDPMTGLTTTGLRPAEVPNVFAATTFTVNGAISPDTMILYNNDYRASYKTDVFGTEANFVLNPLTPNQPLLIRPIVGFQFIQYRENMLITGADTRLVTDPMDPTLTVQQTLNHRIDARARNNMFAPQIGVRAEFVQDWFTFSVTPKFLLGLNRRQDELVTSQLFAIGDGTFQREEATEFAPGLDLKLDARVHLNEHFSVFVGYQLYVLSNISRPLTNVNYDTTDGTTNNASLNTSKQHQLWFGNITVGGELRFH